MVPFKIQYLQAGALSSDRFYQSIHRMPEINQQILENSIQRYLERLQEQPANLEKTDHTKLRDKEQQQGSAAHSGEGDRKKQRAKSRHHENIVEKDEQGHITHIDVKI